VGRGTISWSLGRGKILSPPWTLTLPRLLLEAFRVTVNPLAAVKEWMRRKKALDKERIRPYPEA